MPTLSRLRLLLPLWSLWRLVLTGCLCVAIPLQGFAAVSKALCLHHAAGVDHAAQGPAPPHQASALRHTTTDHTRHHDQQPGQHHTSTDCSQCGDCCPGLAPMPSQSLPAMPLPMAQAAPTVGSAPAPSFLTGGPERPPRRSA